MKYLFLFAHPDDETVACAGTLHKLAQAGEDVLVVSVTDGGGGQVSGKAKAKLASHASVGSLRRQELEEALQFLGVTKHQVLEFTDGHITNEMVWGELRSKIIDVIDAYQPDVVITFDHSGWYFHLDHVAVSIATTLAVQQAKYPPNVFFLVHFRVSQSKWKYIYSETLPITHRVDVTDLKEKKLQALNLHASQDLAEPHRQVKSEEHHYELYQLAQATAEGEKILKNQSLFVPTHPALDAEQPGT